MDNFKVCKNGHYYQNSYQECPYCPQASASPSAADDGGTVQFNSEKTQVFNNPAANSAAGGHAKPDNSKTQVMPGGAPLHSSNTTSPQGTSTNSRKLVGWLVTFDGNPNGRDFRIFEGRNTIGYAAGNDVTVDFDSAVSTKHTTILYRLGVFLFKDELSTNGTFLNGELTNEGALKDGDKLKVGNTVFLLRTANEN